MIPARCRSRCAVLAPRARFFSVPALAGGQLDGLGGPATPCGTLGRCRGAFAYITGVLHDGEQIPLCRLRYSGSAHSFGFAIYSAAHDRYQAAALLTGLGSGTPQQALDTACTIHLADIGQ